MSKGARGARPAYAALDGRDGTPPGAGWSVYGRDDELGSISLLTAGRILAGARSIEAGKVFSLNWSLELPAPALFGRRVVKHAIIDLDPVGTEDRYDDFYPQASSQWDGLSHIRHPRHGFYQGHERAAITGLAGSRLGIEHWARRGIAGRFVLADLARFRVSQGRELRCDQSEAISVAEIEACLDHQKIALVTGDILLLRFGWTGWYETTDSATRARLAQSDLFAAPGLENAERTAAWIWDRGLAAIAADNPALEVQPFDESRPDGFLHYRLIPLLGLAIGELFALDGLAEDCAADGRYSGLLVAAPLNKLGGCGSPANAIAIK